MNNKFDELNVVEVKGNLRFALVRVTTEQVGLLECETFKAKSTDPIINSHSDEMARRRKCRVKTALLLKQGLLTRLPCEICGNPKSQSHHEDYSRPDYIKWLCQKHHTKRHWEIKNMAFNSNGQN